MPDYIWSEIRINHESCSGNMFYFFNPSDAARFLIYDPSSGSCGGGGPRGLSQRAPGPEAGDKSNPLWAVSLIRVEEDRQITPEEKLKTQGQKLRLSVRWLHVGDGLTTADNRELETTGMSESPNPTMTADCRLRHISTPADTVYSLYTAGRSAVIRWPCAPYHRRVCTV